MTLKLHYRSCVVNSKAMSFCCKKDLISILPALMVCRCLSWLYLGQTSAKDFLLEQGGIGITEETSPCCCEGNPTIPRTLALHSEMHFVISVTAAGSFAESTPLCVFLLSCLKWVWWNTLSSSPLKQIYFLIQAKQFQCAPQSDTLNSHSKFMSISSFLIHMLLIVSWFCFVEISEKRVMRKQKRKMSVWLLTMTSAG